MDWERRAIKLYDEFVTLNGRKPSLSEARDLLVQMTPLLNKGKPEITTEEINQFVDQAVSSLEHKKDD